MGGAGVSGGEKFPMSFEPATSASSERHHNHLDYPPCLLSYFGVFLASFCSKDIMSKGFGWWAGPDFRKEENFSNLSNRRFGINEFRARYIPPRVSILSNIRKRGV